jgi:hypothetical protein
MLIGARGRFLAAPRGPAAALSRPAAAPPARRTRASSFAGGGYAEPPPSDDEEPDRFGFYGDDMNPERAKQIVRSLNISYHAKAKPMTGKALRDLFTDKWGVVYSAQICIGEQFQVHLQIEPRKLSEADADGKNKANVLLSGIGALLTEWGVADAAWREIAKHPAKRVPSSGLLIPLPVYYYPGRGAGSAASSRDSGDFSPDGDGARDLMPPSDSWNVFDQSESSGDPPT